SQNGVISNSDDLRFVSPKRRVRNATAKLALEPGSRPSNFPHYLKPPRVHGPQNIHPIFFFAFLRVNLSAFCFCYVLRAPVLSCWCSPSVDVRGLAWRARPSRGCGVALPPACRSASTAPPR